MNNTNHLLPTDVVVFDDATHTYTVNGVPYISVTTLIKHFGLSADYTGIPLDVLQKAADKGKAIHKALELYVNGDQSQLGTLSELDMFHNYITTRGIDLSQAESEKVYYNHKYRIAGTIDFRYIEDNTKVVADFKTTSTLHVDTVAWQLSIYNYMVCNGNPIEYYFNALKVFHFTQGRMYVRDVYMIDIDAVESLLQAYLDGATSFTYTKPNLIISDSQEKLLSQLLTEKEQYKEIIDKIDEKVDEILDAVKTEMIKTKHYTHKTDLVKISYVYPQTRKSLDTTAVKDYFKKTGGDIDQYYKTTTTKDSVKVELMKQDNATAVAEVDEYDEL